METGAPRYRAFISYSHADERWGRWLHRALETYRVPRRLVGRPTGAGTIPRRLLPIFRDRDEMASSSQLAATINQALAESAFQIVICSPHAASSRWVNEEVRAFKRLGREHRILAFIVDGAPNASETPGAGLAECFPRALRHQLDEAGEIGETRAEVVAADARAGKDGRENAKLKLIAGMLGVGFDELKQREKTRQRLRVAAAIAAVVGVALAIGGALRIQQQAHAREQQVEYLQRLIDLGRDNVGSDQFARAAAFLGAAYSSGEQTADVRFLLARALPSVEAMALKAFRVQDDSYAMQLAYTPDGAEVLVAEHGNTSKKNSVIVLDAGSGAAITTIDDVPYWPDIAFSSPAGRVLLSGVRSPNDLEALTQIYDFQSGRRLFEMVGTSDHLRRDGLSGISTAAKDLQLKRLVAVTPDRKATIWDAADHKPRMLPATQVVSAKISQDGSEVVTGDEHGEIVVWDAARGLRLRTLQSRPRKPTVPFFLDKLIVSLADNGAISLWDAATLEFEGALGGHGRRVIGAQPDAARGRLLTRAEGEPVRVWDIATQRSIFVTPEPQEAYQGIDLTSDGKWAVALTLDGVLSLFALNGGNRVALLDGHNAPILNAALRPDGGRLLSAGYDGWIREWSLDRLKAVPSRTPAHAANHNRYDNAVTWAGFDGDGHILSVGSDGMVRRWLDNGESQPFAGHRDSIVAASLDAGRGRLITGSADRTARVWDLASGNAVSVLAGAHSTRIERVALSADGKLAATIDFVEPVAQVWDADTGDHIATLKGHAASLRNLRFIGDGRRLVTASSDNSARIWDARTGQLLFSLEGHAAPIWTAVPSPDGQRIVTVSADHSARLWNAADGLLVRTLTADDAGELESATFTKDSHRVAIGADNGMVLIWDLRSGEVRRLTGLDAGFSDQVAFNADETLVASPSLRSGELGVWAVDSGRLLMKWKDPSRHFLSVAFSPDGKRLVAAGPGRGDTADFPVFDVSLETRTPEQIAAVIRCKSPWKVDGERLLPHAPEAPNCPGLVDAPR